MYKISSILLIFHHFTKFLYPIFFLLNKIFLQKIKKIFENLLFFIKEKKLIIVGYDDKCDATMTQEMATAAFRFGHSLIRNIFPRMNAEYEEETDGLDLKVNFKKICFEVFKNLLKLFHF